MIARISFKTKLLGSALVCFAAFAMSLASIAAEAIKVAVIAPISGPFHMIGKFPFVVHIFS